MKQKPQGMHKDFWGGALMTVVGLWATHQALQYHVGTLSEMGPGYFPTILGVILTLTGLLIASKGYFAQAEPRGEALPAEWKAWLLISASIVAFIVLATYLGLVPAAFGIVFISALADRRNSWKSAAILAAALVVASVIVFWWGLQIQLPLFSWS